MINTFLSSITLDQGLVTGTQFSLPIQLATPTDAELKNGQVVMWFDPTPGACVLHFKGCDSAGTVVNATISLS